LEGTAMTRSIALLAGAAKESLKGFPEFKYSN
jgi:hypothetical protein